MNDLHLTDLNVLLHVMSKNIPKKPSKKRARQKDITAKTKVHKNQGESFYLEKQGGNDCCSGLRIEPDQW